MTPNDEIQRELELAGIVGESGLLSGGDIPTIRQQVPGEIWLDSTEADLGEVVCFDPSGAAYRKAGDATGALDAFLRVRDSDSALAFAVQHGPLFLCTHRSPAWHTAPTFFSDDNKREICRPTGRESIDDWLRYADRARAIVDLRSRMTMMADEEVQVAGMRIALDLDLNEWLELSGVRPRAVWSGDELQTPLVGSQTMTTLALQLLGVVGGNRDVATCSVCREPYPRDRKPQRDRRNYCSDDCARQGDALRQRAYRQRRKSARSPQNSRTPRPTTNVAKED